MEFTLEDSYGDVMMFFLLDDGVVQSKNTRAHELLRAIDSNLFPHVMRAAHTQGYSDLTAFTCEINNYLFKLHESQQANAHFETYIRGLKHYVQRLEAYLMNDPHVSMRPEPPLSP